MAVIEIPPGIDFSKTPLVPNPDGSPPNFIDPPSLEAATIAVSTIVLIVSFTFVLLRLRTNFKIHGRLALDDYFCIAAWSFSIAYTAIVITEIPTARHAWDVPLSAIDVSWIKRSAVISTIYGPTIWLAKAAILTLYLRVFGVVKWLRWSCYIGIGVLFAAYWSLVPLCLVYDFPHGNEIWDLSTTIRAAKTELGFVIVSVISVVSDFYILILPFPVLLKLQMSPKKKLGLCLVFLGAIIGIVASILALYFRVIVWQNKATDLTWNEASATLVSVVELQVAVMISCTPALAASWNHLLRDSRLVSSFRSVFRSTESLLRVISVESIVKGKESASAPDRNLVSLESFELATSR